MAKIDQQVIEELKKYTAGAEPEIYLYVVDMPPFWLQLLLAGGILGATAQKPYMLGVSKNTLHFAKTSMWKVGKFTGDHFSITADEIESVKFSKIGPAQYYKLKLKDGRKFNLAANSFFKKMEKHGENIDRLKTFLESVVPNAA